MKVVVTGIGVTAPNGLGTEDFWHRTCHGCSGIQAITSFDTTGYRSTVGGEITDFIAEEFLPGRLIPQTDRMTKLALVAAAEALADAAVSPETFDRSEAGVVTAATSGGYEFGQRELQNLWSLGPDRVSAYQSYAWFYAVNTGQISIRHDLRGPAGVVVSDGAGGLDALAQVRRQIRRGTPLSVGGGMDASLCPWGWIAHQATGRMSGSNDPDRSYLPFDAQADGHVPGEGGAMLVVEQEAAATARDVPRIYGRIAGYGATFDPHPRTGRPPALRAAVERALDDAEIEPGAVDVVFADGAAVPDLDRIEASVLRAVFGAGAVPVTVTKSMTGRLGGGAGAVDVATALLAMRDALIPPTVHSRPAPEYELDLVTHLRIQPLQTALVIARGHGGFNSALVLQSA
ncbi:ketosynthase chain-length factor [Nocardia jinanensis]|uniref:Actinorhodin polyketide putative beta-ketoacyl synthase 2 n=1 Tax=Nocardia jinanensis TaxID=382504 RepID=A0A917VYV4_9NOCA|nr:ketosynthase chain-length factor [Nocardia jinanensis]GGL46412.1 actinorhodin polyketide putative beta-ketoacyl synthase 2 [Nocardia jinanensis]